MKNAILFLVGLLLLAQCSTSKHPGNPETAADSWLIPIEDIANLGVNPDQISAIVKPVFIPIGQSNLRNNEIVYVLNIDDKTKVYPVSVLHAHEIVNDSLSENYFALTYCPITTSGILWNRRIRGKVTTFGVSGMLYHENLMPYDRNTRSYWSQMRMDCVHGLYIREKVTTIPILRTSFETIKNSLPEASVLIDININQKITSTEKSSQDITEYFGVPGDRNTLLISMNNFGDSVSLLPIKTQNLQLIVAGSKSANFMVAFEAGIPSNANRIFTPLQNRFPIIMKDNVGNIYNVFGKITEGPDKGKKLEIPRSFWAKDWAWEAFYPDSRVISATTK